MRSEEINVAFLWPKTADLGVRQVGSALYKDDQLLRRMEEMVTQRRAWTPITGSTKRTEPPEKLSKWIAAQLTHKARVDRALGLPRDITLRLEDFPTDPNQPSNRIISTSRNIAYLVDETANFLHTLAEAFGPQAREKANTLLNTEIGTFLYVTNSIASGGRALFGDPFTGQATAYSRIFTFDLFGGRVLNFVAYYPHQLYSQCFTRTGTRPANKGARMLASQATMLITTGGVLISPVPWGII